MTDWGHRKTFRVSCQRQDRLPDELGGRRIVQERSPPDLFLIAI